MEGRGLGGKATGPGQLDSNEGLFSATVRVRRQPGQAWGDSCSKQVVECSGRQSTLICLHLYKGRAGSVTAEAGFGRSDSESTLSCFS